MLITSWRITTRYLVLLYYKRKGKYGVVIKSEIESIILNGCGADVGMWWKGYRNWRTLIF